MPFRELDFFELAPEHFRMCRIFARGRGRPDCESHLPPSPFRRRLAARGIKLEENDHVISMSILRHVDADTGERVAYLRMRRSATGDETPVDSEGVERDGEEAAEAATISAERYADLEGKEEFILTVTSRGYGKRSSAYEYRIAGRGG